MILELGQSFNASEWIHITADYSNAVLVAVLPYVSNAVEQLELSVPRPVTLEHVTVCNIAPQRRLSVGIHIKGDWGFLFSDGHIDTIQSSHSYFILQDPDQVPAYFGQVRMSKAEAIELGRQTIRRLGIPLETVFAEQEPRVTEPEKVGTNTVPHYRVEWVDPRSGGPAACVDIDINADAKRLERIAFLTKNLERPPPHIDVIPPPDPRSPRWPKCNPEYAWKLIPIALPAVDEYAQRLSLPIPHPLTTNHVARFSLASNWGWPHSEIELTNGWRFIYRNSMVNGYYAPDNFFNTDNRPIRVKEFIGTARLSEKEATDLVRKTIQKLNYPTNLVHMGFEPGVYRPAVPGIPRVFMFWNTAGEDDLQSKVEAEVDLDRGELKSLYHDDKAYWNHPPPIDVPISLPAPATSRTPPHGPVESPPQRFKVLPTD